MNTKPVHLSEPALRDFDAIVLYYETEGSRLLARSFVSALREALRHISQFPGSGSPRQDLTPEIPELRSWPVSGFPYLVFYAGKEASIDVYRVLHTARDVPASLTEDVTE